MNGHHLNLLKELSKDNKLSQRELSRTLGVSLGSVNYVVSNLIDAGLISVQYETKINEICYTAVRNDTAERMSKDFFSQNEIRRC